MENSTSCGDGCPLAAVRSSRFGPWTSMQRAVLPAGMQRCGARKILVDISQPLTSWWCNNPLEK